MGEKGSTVDRLKDWKTSVPQNLGSVGPNCDWTGEMKDRLSAQDVRYEEGDVILDSR